MLSLTRTEQDAIDHRLNVPDALAEVFDEEWHEQDVYDVCDLLLRRDIDKAMDINGQLVKDILADCVEGSTWVAAVSDAEPWRYAKAIRELRGAANKVAAFVGRELDVPAC